MLLIVIQRVEKCTFFENLLKFGLILNRVAVKVSKKEFPKEEIEILKKCDSELLLKLLDSFSMKLPYIGIIHGLVMTYYEVNSF